MWIVKEKRIKQKEKKMIKGENRDYAVKNRNNNQTILG
jgi:hypothetical protein